MASPTAEHRRQLIYLAKYFRKTKHWRTRSHNIDESFRDQLICYAGAGYATQGNHHSQSGYVLLLNGMIIDSGSKAQGLCAQSSMEAEVIASCFGARAAAAARNSLNELGLKQKPTQIHEGAEACINYSKTTRITARNRHFGVKEQCVRLQHQSKLVEIVPVNTSDQLADLLTKSLGPTAHQRLCDALFVTTNAQTGGGDQ